MGFKDVSSEVSSLADKARERVNAESEPRLYLGASMIGDPCKRKVAFSWHLRHERPFFGGRVLRIFDMGHDGEERMAIYLRDAGFALSTEDSDGNQHGFKILSGNFAGHADGIIRSGPLAMDYPALWEHKALGASPWRSLKSTGLKMDRPTYYGQVQIYMGMFECASCLFTAMNRDTGELYAEIVAYDEDYAADLVNFAADVIQSESAAEFPRLSSDPSFWKCKICQFASACHDIAPAPVVAPQTANGLPAWLRRKIVKQDPAPSSSVADAGAGA